MDAIWEADQARRKERVTIYTVGLGDSDTSNRSPFQDGRRAIGYPSANEITCERVGNMDAVKEVLLMRLANDQATFSNPPEWAKATPHSRALWDFPCVKRANALKSSPNGWYRSASEGESLLASFEELARQIRSRMVE